MKKTEGIIVFLAGALFTGIFIIIGAVMLYKNNDFIKKSIEITATISDIHSSGTGDDEHHEVYVNYSVNGIEYNNIRISEYSSSMYVGKTITLRCNPDEPDKVKDTSVIKAIGIVFVIIGSLGFLICTIISVSCFVQKGNANGSDNIAGSVIDNKGSKSEDNASPYSDSRFDYWNDSERYPDINSANPYAKDKK